MQAHVARSIVRKISGGARAREFSHAAMTKRAAVKPIFTLDDHGDGGRIVGPASPTASPESEF
jgi:hypothetical protein